jgi:hypothetical protein
MITKSELEEAFAGEDTDRAWQVLKDYDKRDADYLIKKYHHCTDYIGLRRLNKVELMFAILDSMLHTCGVAYIAHKDDDEYEALGLSYLNTGDSYAPTIVYDHKDDEWMIISWGDIIEERPNSYL